MPILIASDQCQQDIVARNNKLSEQLAGPWNDQNIKRIWREPEPTNPPDLTGPQQGSWKAETV